MYRMFSVVVLGTALLAQDQSSPNRFVPKDAQFVLRIGAPAQWQHSFAGTKLAKLLQGQTLGPLVHQLTQGFEAGVAEAKQEGKLAPELIDGLLHDYRGETLIAGALDAEDLMAAMSEDRPPGGWVVVSMTPDGKFDLPGLATALGKLAEEEGNDLRDLTVGDHRLRIGTDGPVQITAPFLADGQLVMVLGTDLEAMLPKVLAADNRAELPTGNGPLFLHLDGGTLVDVFLEAMGKQLEAQGSMVPFDVVQVLRDIGLGAIGNLQLSLQPAGEHLRVDMDLQFRGDNLGLLAAAVGEATAPKLLRYVPPGAESFSVAAFDLGALWQAVGKIWEGLGDQVPMSFADVQQQFAESMKVRLQEDLLGHLGKELLMLQDSGAQMAAIADMNEDEPDPSAMFAGYCIGLRLQDGKAFGESFETMLRARGLHAARKTEDYQGQKIHKLKLGGVFDIEYAITDDLLAISLGSSEASQKNLRGVLDQKRAGAAAATEGVQKLLAGLPEGYNGVSVASLSSTFAGVAKLGATIKERGEMTPEGEMVFQVLGPLADEMQRLGIGSMAASMLATKQGIRYVWHW